MTEYREKLIDRMVAIYGLENVYVLMFCELCQCWPVGFPWDNNLLEIVEEHEDNPIFSEE